MRAMATVRRSQQSAVNASNLSPIMWTLHEVGLTTSLYVMQRNICPSAIDDTWHGEHGALSTAAPSGGAGGNFKSPLRGRGTTLPSEKVIIIVDDSVQSGYITVHVICQLTTRPSRGRGVASSHSVLRMSTCHSVESAYVMVTTPDNALQSLFSHKARLPIASCCCRYILNVGVTIHLLLKLINIRVNT